MQGIIHYHAMKQIVILCLMAMTVVGVNAQKMMRSMSPRTMSRFFNAKDIQPDAVEKLSQLYEQSHWTVLSKDSDPSDGTMELVVAKNMRMGFGCLEEDGSDHRGLWLKLERDGGMRLKHILVVFADANEQQLFASELLSMGFTTADDEVFTRSFSFADGTTVVATASLLWQDGLDVAEIDME